MSVVAKTCFNAPAACSGPRPNFMKAASLLRSLEAKAVRQPSFFRTILSPQYVRRVLRATRHSRAGCQPLSRFEPVLLERNPEGVIVYGDVNSTAAVAMVCAKLGVKLVHVEADLRFIRSDMPKEIYRGEYGPSARSQGYPGLKYQKNFEESHAREGYVRRLRGVTFGREAWLSIIPHSRIKMDLLRTERLEHCEECHLHTESARSGYSRTAAS